MSAQAGGAGAPAEPQRDPAVVAEAADLVGAWRSSGRTLTHRGRRVWWRDVAPRSDAGADATAGAEEAEPDPVLVLHGFPTCSFDWRLVLDRLAERRRVVLVDLVGFGLSAKPDQRYSITDQADVAEAVIAEAGLGRVALVTHDMGDTVGGELLARIGEGALNLEVTNRVVTNGSIYIAMAELTAGQEMLLSLPDAAGDLPIDPAAAFIGGVAATSSSDHPIPPVDLEGAWQLASRADGHRLLARTIRYIEDRRAAERRYTGAIETHPSPLGVVWGTEDPVAVVAMVDELVAARPETRVTRLEGVGHYPMLETPDRFADAVIAHLDRPGS